MFFRAVLMFIVARLSLTNSILAQDFTANVTRVLNSLLSVSYDQRIRPEIGGPPTKVMCNMHIKSLGPVSENEETYSMDVYFRQTWYDRRLGFSFPGIDEFSMSWIFMEKIWKPDTFFLNGRGSELHSITSPNKFVRLREDGFLSSSIRLTISAECKMHLRKFPLDSQKCSLIIGSYAYTSEDLQYNWDEKGVTIEKGVEMAQYDVVNVSIVSGKTTIRGRVVTIVLTITTLALEGRADLHVSYATALDWYIIICFAFVFAVMIEYAIINFLNKLATDIQKIIDEEARKKTEMEEEQKLRKDKSFEAEDEFEEIDFRPDAPLRRCHSLPADLASEPVREDTWLPLSPETSSSTKSPLKIFSWYKKYYRRTLSATLDFWKSFNILPNHRGRLLEKGFSQIDIVARKAFPIAFAATVTTYGVLYAYYITDGRDED
ncbi:gamma-aminobutyric acid receptor subunit alpha-4 isoform X2 [Halyomorpha halys]|uniref:gamma-aminobutyric acid receptor subunit alpha-4 isoform X2 n=1 Tax=Halyomorpha halys TaxID=286706 RepID=UPI0006D4EB53|nr:gamma-aminobutyric acid receptor subunit alpha-4-like isoform X2 [Halyomorpha halys]